MSETAGAHDLVERARVLARDVLAPGAAAVDADGVRRADLDALGAAGLLGVTGEPVATFRAVQELLAGADASTWFVQAQHHFAVRLLQGASSPLLTTVLDDLRAGRQVGGAAFSHLRRRPQSPVTAVRVSGGWRYDGAVPWCTGWGLNDVIALGGATDDGRVVFSVVPALEGDGVVAGEPMRLSALSAARTVQLQLTGVVVPDERVALIQPHGEWAAADLRTTVNANPALLGITAAALARLAEIGAQRSLAEAVSAADHLQAGLAQVRQAAYGLADDPASDPAQCLQWRVRAQRLCLDATAAVVAAGAGGSMRVDDPAQRWAREAAFLLVQSQTLDARRAVLASFSGS